MSPSPSANGVVTVIIVMALDISGTLDTATDIMATGIGCDMRPTAIRVIRITATAAMAIARIATTAVAITITGVGATDTISLTGPALGTAVDIDTGAESQGAAPKALALPRANTSPKGYAARALHGRHRTG